MPCLSVWFPHATSGNTIRWQSVKSISEAAKVERLSREQKKHASFHDVCNVAESLSENLSAIHNRSYYLDYLSWPQIKKNKEKFIFGFSQD